jgi:hypothetical protein
MYRKQHGYLRKKSLRYSSCLRYSTVIADVIKYCKSSFVFEINLIELNYFTDAVYSIKDIINTTQRKIFS